jgi:hypothetical protein
MYFRPSSSEHPIEEQLDEAETGQINAQPVDAEVVAHRSRNEASRRQFIDQGLGVLRNMAWMGKE